MQSDNSFGHDDGPFWEEKSLVALTPEEWEALCDGCGLCCLIRLEDEDTGEVFGTKIACRLLDQAKCRCTDYENRQVEVPTCLLLTPESVPRLHWLPDSCAYVRRHRGEPLAWWHPLVSGDPDTVHQAGISVRGRTIREGTVAERDYEDYIVDWA